LVEFGIAAEGAEGAPAQPRAPQRATYS